MEIGIKSLCLSSTGIGIALITCMSGCSIQQEPSVQKPNFIVILTDDQGYGDLGCYGSPNILTPNIDRMAMEGIRFTSFYAASVCGPSRAQLMTGCYPARVGQARNTNPTTTDGLSMDEITIADLLRDQGYATMLVGKWHLGHMPGYLPVDRGFDAFFGIPYSNDMWRYHPRMPLEENEDNLMAAIRERAAYTGFAGEGSYFPPGAGFSNDLPLMVDHEVTELNPDQRLLTARFTEKALHFIEENREQPFFLYLAHIMPHVPLFVSDRFEGKSVRGLYGDVMMEIDWGVGKILKLLKELGIDENTMVVFTSDNGPWLEYGIDGGSAGPLRSGKATLYEGGVRVPAIFRWPGKIPAGTTTGVISGNHDLLPTLAGLAGTGAPKDRIIDGRDLWPLLSDKSNESPHEFFHYMGASPKGQVNYQGIRDKRWKLMFRINANGTAIGRELYDLEADVSERFNRIDQHPEIAASLRNEAQEFYDDLVQNIR